MRFVNFENDWQHYVLNEVCKYKSKSDYSTKKYYVSTENLLQNYGGIEQYNSDENVVGNKFIKDNILMSNIRPYLRKVWKATFSGVSNSDVLVFETFQNITADFLYYLIANDKFVNYVMSSVKGSKMPRGDKNAIMDYMVSVPAIEEQHKITDLLEIIDKRISTQNKIIENLKYYKKIISDNFLYSKDTISYKPLKEFGKLKNGYAFKSENYVENGLYNIITIANVSGDRYIQTKECNKIKDLPNDIQKHQVLQENDILISLTGNVGRVSLATNGQHLLNQRVGLFELFDKNLTEYIYQCLSNKRFEKSMTLKGQGAAQLNIGKDDIENYLIPQPNNESKKIISLLSYIDKKISIEYSLLQKYREQKSFLLSNMFI